MALNPGAEALHINYQQPHGREEREAAQRIAHHYGALLHYASFHLAFAVTTSDPAMLVPGRNLILLSLAATLGHPVLGCNADDRDGYPDCRPEFFEAVRPLIDVVTPLLHYSKPEIGGLARSLGVPVELTWSCYYPTDDGECGACDACAGRDRALA
jgi:7-cyano-7-deazaguanine synthase